MEWDYGAIAAELLDWYGRCGRSFPFRGTRDPYRVWVSEIMLQQTRTQTAGAYYERFLRRFPTLRDLAAAPEEEVLKLWEGLGYYSRARNLRRAAGLVLERHGGSLPDNIMELRALPGIGDYTAAAVASIAFGVPEPALDGNLKRVLSRLFCMRHDVDSPAGREALLGHGRLLLSAGRPGDLNQALMDLGATLCLPGSPACGDCPLPAYCAARRLGEERDLPRTVKKSRPLAVPVGVAIVACAGRVLLLRRQEALLRGMYVFLLCEGDASEEALAKQLRGLGIEASAPLFLGRGRHVFTHRVWQMEVRLVRANRETAVENGLWADPDRLASLPMPAAMGKARAFALEALDRPGLSAAGTVSQAMRLK